METLKEVEKLFFELASESRLSILHMLNKKSLKMTELGKSLDMTSTETFRQLQRLSKSSFISKDVDGFYSLTPFGKLVLFLSPSFEFILRHKQYFLEHDVSNLPSEFIFRIGELNRGILKTDLSEVVKLIEEMMNNAEDHIWTLTRQVFATHARAIEGRFKNGVSFRSLHPKDMIPTEINYPEFKQYIERRYLPKISQIMVITEKEAMLALPLMDDNLDFAAFFGKGPDFKKWATDLYLHYWKLGVTIDKEINKQEKTQPNKDAG